jgi:hypothetical protein
MRKLVLLALGAAAAAVAVQYVRQRSARLAGEEGESPDLDVVGDVPGWIGETAGAVHGNGHH